MGLRREAELFLCSGQWQNCPWKAVPGFKTVANDFKTVKDFQNKFRILENPYKQLKGPEFNIEAGEQSFSSIHFGHKSSRSAPITGGLPGRAAPPLKAAPRGRSGAELLR
jgi:hypothetical protein